MPAWINTGWPCGGRAGWNFVTGANAEDAHNFSHDSHTAHGERYDRAEEFADVVLGLWDSFDDGAFVRDEREESLLTFMVYLNEGFAGGDTRFYDYDVSVTPRTGMALLFQHFTLHEGCSVTAGVKYALRTDVMYRR